MQGFKIKPDVKLEDLIKIATQQGQVDVGVIAPNGEEYIKLEINIKQDDTVNIIIDIHSSSWDISDKGFSAFEKICKENPNEIIEHSSDKRVLNVEVKTTKVEFWLHKLFELLEQDENLKKISTS